MHKTHYDSGDLFWRKLVVSVAIFMALSSAAWARQEGIRRIEIEQNPLAVTFFLTGEIPVKVVQIEKKELLVALKNVRLETEFKILGKNGSPITNVVVENLQGNVLAVIFTSKTPYENIQSRFDAAASSFVVTLGSKTGPAPAKPPPEKPAAVPQAAKPETSPEPAPEMPASVTISEARQERSPAQMAAAEQQPAENLFDTPVKVGAATVQIPTQRERGKYQGDLSDLLVAIDEIGCPSQPVAAAVSALKNGLDTEAFNALDQYISQQNLNCLEQAYFLKAYAFYRATQESDYPGLFQAERLFQDALISYPQSDYLAYGYAAMGMIQKKLKNMSAAEGYFNIVKQGYLTYPGLPEVMFHLAEIYDHKGYEDKALTYFKQVFEDTAENSYITDAGIGYGKALFQKRQYLDALKILDHVMMTAPKKAYHSPELLLNIGNANYEVGQSQQARENLMRALNLFPEIPTQDVVLSRIGDTYGMENNPEKALKIYALVREKYPDTEGYIASSIGIARYLEKDADKIEIYQMIKTRFPENSYARIAMMRMAEIYQAAGEYDKCIKEIEDLLATHPRGLRYEAVKLMQKAYEALFQKQLKGDGYTQILNRYELEHSRIDRMGSRLIALNVGLAYLEAKLYDQAFNHLISAYKQYDRRSRSESLMFGLGVAMDETGKKADALKVLDAFSNRFTKSPHRGESLLRAGTIYLEKEDYAAASSRFRSAYAISDNHLEKGSILLLHADVHEQKGDMADAAAFRERAVKEIALAPGNNYDILTKSYKALGRTYMALTDYVASADAYAKALGFSDDETEQANLGFLLGDAYQKGNILQKAKDAYQQVVSTYDSVWARLAQQRLDTLELAQTVQNS